MAKVKNHYFVLDNGCEFDKNLDIERPLEGLEIDLTEAIETGAVGPLGAEMDYNQIDDLKSISGRISDNFEAMDAERAIRNAAKSSATNSSVASTPNE